MHEDVRTVFKRVAQEYEKEYEGYNIRVLAEDHGKVQWRINDDYYSSNVAGMSENMMRKFLRTAITVQVVKEHGFQPMDLLFKLTYENAHNCAVAKFGEMYATCILGSHLMHSDEFSVSLNQSMIQDFVDDTREAIEAIEAIADNVRKQEMVVMSMYDVLAGLCPNTAKAAFTVSQSEPLYVITNATRNCGAMALLNDNIFKKLSDKLDSNLMILPSSKHEVIALPVGMPYKEAKEMIRLVNDTELERNEILGFEPMYFYRNVGKVSYQDGEPLQLKPLVK